MIRQRQGTKVRAEGLRPGWQSRAASAIARGRILGVLFFMIFCSNAGAASGASETGQVCFKQHCFVVEIADTPARQQRGLMFRRKMALDRGMFFVFEEEGLAPFWMKHTKIPLDIIWLNRHLQIVFIEHAAPPCRKNPCPIYNRDVPAKYVLEINGGLARQMGLMVGDTLEWRAEACRTCGSSVK